MKKTQIIIIIIALVLTLGCVGTFAILYFATDTFKSDQEMFYKYASQIDLKEFIDLKSYNTYSKRLENEAYSNEGAFTFELAQEEQVISESIVYAGYTDPENKTANYDISINKDDEELLAMNYLNKQDFYGVLFKDVVNKYIVIENNNLKEFASKIGISDTSEIPNKIEIIPEEINNINFEEINTLLNNYLNIAIKEIPEDNYLKIEKQEIALGTETIEADGYQVKLKVKDIQKILTKVLENARDDEQIYNLVNSEDITFEDYQEAIDQLLEGLQEEIPDEENIQVITISVYKQGKDAVKLSLVIGEKEPKNTMELSVEKLHNSIRLGYDYFTTTFSGTSENKIIITRTATSEEQEIVEGLITQIEDGEEQSNAKVTITRDGALTSNNVAFDLNINFSIDMSVFDPTAENPSLNIGMKNSTNFDGVPKEGDFEQGNHLVINGLSPEQITNLFTNLGSLLDEKLKDEMFVTLITRTMNVNYNLYDLAEQAEQATQNALEQEQQLSNGITPEDYSPVMPDNTSSETQSSNQSTMSQMFND